MTQGLMYWCCCIVTWLASWFLTLLFASSFIMFFPTGTYTFNLFPRFVTILLVCILSLCSLSFSFFTWLVALCLLAFLRYSCRHSCDSLPSWAVLLLARVAAIRLHTFFLSSLMAFLQFAFFFLGFLGTVFPQIEARASISFKQVLPQLLNGAGLNMAGLIRAYNGD